MKAKIVCITGCTKGLGRAMVENFAASGWSIIGCGRSAEAINSLTAEHPVGNLFRSVDTSDDGAVGAFVEEFLSEVGTPDFLLNNAALINANAPLWEVEPAEFSQVVDVNIKGVFFVTRHVLPAMIAAGSGVIVNFSSGWGRSTAPDVAPYCATKWAIEGMTQALSQELPKGLAAVALNPGVINTDMLQSCFGSGADGYGTADQWAKTAVPFLAGLSAKDNGRALTAP